MSKVICAMCGAEAEKTGRAQKYCTACARERTKIRQAKATADRAEKRKAEKEDAPLKLAECRRCGRMIMGKHKRRLCAACQDAGKRERAMLRAQEAGEDKGPQPMRCAVCGKEFHRRNSVQKYCTACAAGATRHKKAPQMMQCTMCGETIERKNKRQKYCKKCAVKARSGPRKEKRPEDATAKTREYTCEMCGKTFLSDGVTAKYCGENCAKDAARQQSRERKRAAAETRKAQQYKQPVSKDNLQKVSRIAAENGISYGKLTTIAAANGGKLPGWIRVPEECRGAYVGGGKV